MPEAAGWTYDTRFPFEAPLATGHPARHDVYAKGDGPPILIIQELPGIGPETLALADRLVAAGFRVHIPHLFGRFGRTQTTLNMLRLLCIRREIDIFARGRESPVTAWLRALCQHIRGPAKGVGVIGMCLTGSFALTMMADDAVLGAVAAQPSLPARGPAEPLHMSVADIAAARAGMQAKGPALAMRYEDDSICRREVFEATARSFGPDLQTIQFPGDAHALLTGHFLQAAYDRTEAYFRARMT